MSLLHKTRIMESDVITLSYAEISEISASRALQTELGLRLFQVLFPIRPSISRTLLITNMVTEMCVTDSRNFVVAYQKFNRAYFVIHQSPPFLLEV